MIILLEVSYAWIIWDFRIKVKLIQKPSHFYFETVFLIIILFLQVYLHFP